MTETKNWIECIHVFYYPSQIIPRKWNFYYWNFCAIEDWIIFVHILTNFKYLRRTTNSRNPVLWHAKYYNTLWYKIIINMKTM